MIENIEDICSILGKNSLLIELGSGSSKKIRLLLSGLQSPAGYAPIDISEEHLISSVNILAHDYPNLRILPVSADYTQPFSLPKFDFIYSIWYKITIFIFITISCVISFESVCPSIWMINVGLKTSILLLTGSEANVSAIN